MQSRPRQILTLNIIKAKADLIACAIPLVLGLLHRNPGLSMAVKVTYEQESHGFVGCVHRTSYGARTLLGRVETNVAFIVFKAAMLLGCASPELVVSLCGVCNPISCVYARALRTNLTPRHSHWLQRFDTAPAPLALCLVPLLCKSALPLLVTSVA